METLKDILYSWNDLLIVIVAVLFILQPFKTRRKTHVFYAIGAATYLLLMALYVFYPPDMEKFINGNIIYVSFLLLLLSCSIISIAMGWYYAIRSKRESNQSLNSAPKSGAN